MALSDIAHLSIPFADLPTDIADAFMWASDRDDLIELGVPDDEGFPTVSIRKCCDGARGGSRGQRLRHAGRGA